MEGCLALYGVFYPMAQLFSVSISESIRSKYNIGITGTRVDTQKTSKNLLAHENAYKPRWLRIILIPRLIPSSYPFFAYFSFKRAFSTKMVAHNTETSTYPFLSAALAAISAAALAAISAAARNCF